jgi:putative transcriptional regulator
MDEFSKKINLNGKFLIAMPGMGDPRFKNAVIYLCSHNAEGTMGLIINKLATNFNISDLLNQLNIETSNILEPFPIYLGGPVEPYRGFILHSLDYFNKEKTIKIDNVLGMTSTLDIVEDIVTNKGPKTFFVALGYSGWDAGQIEMEIKNNGWLVSDAKTDIIFQNNNKNKWEDSLKIFNVDPKFLSADGGTA